MSALNIIFIHLADTAHSEYANITKQSLKLLFTAILTSRAQEIFILTLQQFSFSST